MRVTFILLRRELHATFTSFGYYLLLAIVASVTAFLFLNQLGVQGYDTRRALLGSFTWLYLLTIGLAPLLTMRLLAEERRSGSIELLMTAPVDDSQVVAAKYLSSVIVFGTFMTPIWFSHIVLAAFFDAAIDWGQLCAATLGFVNVALIFLAVGLLASAVCSVQL